MTIQNIVGESRKQSFSRGPGCGGFGRDKAKSRSEIALDVGER
jgi:hypothetical protein